MTRFLMAILRYPLAKQPDQSISTSEAGRRGAAIRNERARQAEFARNREMVHKLCAFTGRPVPEVYR